MAVRIIKPDAGNVLELQDAGGTPRIELNDGGTTLLKDEGGTTAISIAAAGDVSVTEDIIIGDGKYIGSSSAPTALQIDSVGRISKILQPAFSTSLGSDQTSPADGATINFDTEAFDIGANFNTSTKTFTAPIGGKYLFNVRCRLSAVDNNSTFIYINLVTTGGTYASIFTLSGADGGDFAHWHVNLPVICNMATSNTAYVKYNFSGGNTVGSFVSGVFGSEFSGYLLG